MARRITFLGPFPVMVNPPIITFSPMSTFPRVETLRTCDGGVAVGVADGDAVGVAVAVAVAVAVGVAAAVAVGVAVAVAVGVGFAEALTVMLTLAVLLPQRPSVIV